MMRLLLDRGARIDLGDDETSLVNYAVSTGDSAAVRLLIERGAKVPADEWPVARALWRPDADLVSLLIQHGGAVPKDWRQRLSLATFGSSKERAKVEALLEKAAP